MKKSVLKVEIKKNCIVNKLERKDFIVQEWQTFIRALPKSISKEKLKIIDNNLGFKNCGNSEIMMEWYTKALENNYTEINGEIEDFVTKVGRRKYLMPIYAAMNSSNPKLAESIFNKVPEQEAEKQ